MRDLFIDVLLEIPVTELAQMPDPTRGLWELMREKADAACEEQHARLRTDREPEVVVRQGRHPLLGLDMFLCASRWAVVAPDSVTPAA